MKLLINTASTFKGGSIQVARSFLEECKQFKKHEYHVVLGTSMAKIVPTASFPKNFTFYTINHRPATRVFSLKSTSSFLKEIEIKSNPDVVFTTSGPAYWRPMSPHVVGYNLPHYVYPDSPFWSTLSLTKRIKWKFKKQIIRHFFKNDADNYAVQTDDINVRLRKFLQTNNVDTVSNTCNGYYFQPRPAPPKLPTKREREFRLLTLSAWYPHKHLDVIPDVIDMLDDDLKGRVRFILTLPDEDFKAHFPARYERNIINVKPVKIEEGPALYRECDALFLPTLLECFSASYAEAMTMEKPIITSDLGFAHTVCQDAALYFDPMNPKNIAQTITSLVQSRKLRDTLVEKGKKRISDFGSARSRAEKYLRICSQIARKK